MVNLCLYYGFQRHEIEADPDDGLETLFYQVFSLTNVAPEDQALFGLEPGPLTLTGAAFSAATFAEGQVIALMEPVPDLVHHTAGAYWRWCTVFTVAVAVGFHHGCQEFRSRVPTVLCPFLMCR
jgi:hypothetical protein